MDKETLSNYGWIVICVLVLAVMLALASPFGNFVADAIKSTAQGLFDVNQGALDAAGIQIMEQEFENMLSDKAPALNPTGATISNNTYTHGDYIYSRRIISGNELGAQTLDEAKEIVKPLMVEMYADTGATTWDELVALFVEYGMVSNEDELWVMLELTEDTFEPSVLGNEWAVSLNENVTDRNQASYGEILESINGMPVTDITALFYDCKSLVIAPKIPSTVTVIGQSAFDGCTALTSIIIPDGVTTIGTQAFNYCRSLESITIPNSVTTIEDNNFQECDSLTSIAFPNSVTSIGINSFTGCDSLKTVNIGSGVTTIEASFLFMTPSLDTIIVDKNNPAYCSVDNILYTKDMTHMVMYAQGKPETSFTMPDSVITIEPSAFKNYTTLTEINLSNNLTRLPNFAFEGCTNLTSMIIPESVTSIGYWVFSECDSLTSITLESPSGWIRTQYNNMQEPTDIVEIPESVLSDPTVAVNYLKAGGYYWDKS